MDRGIHGQTNRLRNARSDEHTHRQSQGQMNVLTDKHMDRRTHTQTHKYTEGQTVAVTT